MPCLLQQLERERERGKERERDRVDKCSTLNKWETFEGYPILRLASKIQS